MNILLISSIYPLPTANNQGTKVCHYFAKEWVKQGHCVQVIHVQAVYPRPFYWIARLCKSLIASKTGAVVYTQRDKGGIYKMDGVQVMRLPVFKLIPHRTFAKISIKDTIKKIIGHNIKNNFTPDLILAHFSNPQIELLSLLKSFYPTVKNALIVHGDIELTKNVYGSRLLNLVKSIDVWGFRNKGDKQKFASQITQVDKSFMCFSGIPEEYLAEKNERKYEKGVRSFMYVGGMIERKYPVAIIEALEKTSLKGNYQIDYVGEGHLLDVLKHKIDNLGIINCVTIHGSLPREEIISLYDRADCMVMISSGEVYGLVYLEAMARGCITIASRGEGFDGVIEDGVNGFLCEAGNSDDLAKIIEKINQMSSEELRIISMNAWNTARQLTDALAAKRYLNDVLKSIKE